MQTRASFVYLVIIDRKYNRSTDTGRFELIHKGLPVSVPIYIGIDLRVEGKTCKTGRSHHNNSTVNGTNNNHLNITAPVSAPPQVSSSSKDPSNEHGSLPLHSTSALDNHHATPCSTGDELNQSTSGCNDIASSSDSLLEQPDDCRYHFHPNTKPNQMSIPKGDTRRKKTKNNVNRITVDTLPVDQLNRSKINDCIPSPKGR